MKPLPLFLALLASPPTFASDWIVNPEASRIDIETTAFGANVSGQFATFDADISLDPEDLSSASIIGRVEVSSGDTGNPQYNSEMVGGHGLDAENHPLATFTSERIEEASDCSQGDGHCYLATGSLELAGRSHPANLSFRLMIEGDEAIANGELTIIRANYGIGGSNWGASAETVQVLLHIEASRAQ